MANKISKKDTLVAAFSNEFYSAVESILKAKCKDANTVPRAEVAQALRKQKLFAVEHETMLTLMVGLAVGEGNVPDFAATRGRNGGIYSISQTDAWNAQVDAAEAALAKS